jgi:hypothetical protein
MATKKNDGPVKLEASEDFDFDGISIDGEMSLDLSGVEAREAPTFEALKNGIYDMEVVSSEFRFKDDDESKPQLVTIFRTTDPKYNNTQVWYYLAFYGKRPDISTQNLTDLIRAAIPHYDLSNVKLAEVAEELEGARLRVAVKRDKRPDGKGFSNSVRYVRPAEEEGESGGFDFD